MATIREYEQGAERGFEVRGWADGKQYKRRFPAPADARGRLSMKKAEAAANAFKAGQDNAKYTGGAPALDRTTTVAAYAQQWAAARDHHRSTARRIQGHLKHISGSRLGSRPLYAVKPSEVQAWVTERSRGTGDRKGLSPRTMRTHYATLKSVFSMAVDDGLIGKSPCLRSITLPKIAKADFVPLTVDQVDALIEAMPERYAAMVAVQAGLGLRVGELLALQVRDVDWLRGRSVRIERQQSDERANNCMPTKNGEVRDVPLPQLVMDALQAHLAADPQPDHDGFIFRSRFGNALRQDHYTQRILRPAIESLNLPIKVTSHHLRHHYVSVLLDAGEPVTVVAARIGDTVDMVTKIYAHMMPKTEERTRSAIDNAWAEARERREADVLAR